MLWWLSGPRVPRPLSCGKFEKHENGWHQPALRHEDVWGNGCIDPRTLDLGTSRSWVVRFTWRPLYAREGASGTHWIGDWLGLRTELDMELRKILPLLGLELRPLGRSVRIELLYRRRYLYLNSTSSQEEWKFHEIILRKREDTRMISNRFTSTLLLFLHKIR
jgi:hypothetical protein